MTKPPKLLRLAVLLSGSGTSLENLFEKIEARDLPAKIVLVIASREDAFGLERARRRGVPAVSVPRKGFETVHAFNDAVHRELEKVEIDFIALLGFMCLFETRNFNGRTINVHPALIPAFCGKGYYGERVHRAVLEAGVKVSGATVHFVDAQYDHGPIILQEAIPVREDDTPESLAIRVQALERKLVPEAIRLFAEGRLRIDGQRVHVAAGGGKALETQRSGY